MIRHQRMGVNALVTIEGELDLASLPQLTAVVAAARDEALEHLVVDLRGVTFLDSTSIEFLLRLSANLEEANAELVLVRGSRVVNRLFEILDLGRVVTVVDDLPDYLTPS
jgi:anti-anti-sigma factor